MGATIGWFFRDVNPPFEEFGEMWELSLDKLMDRPFVPYGFLRFVQTTPKVKLATYQRLTNSMRSSSKAVIRSWIRMFKLAWGDPDKACREAVRPRGSEWANT
jgi:hypothetical protein